MNTSTDASCSSEGISTSVIAFPMHGYRKMVDEGFRTRDAHLIERFTRFAQPSGVVEVMSRPEPKVLAYPQRWIKRERKPGREGLIDHSSETWRVPRPTDRRRWWVDSARHYEMPRADASTLAVIWNPFVAVSNISEAVFNGKRGTVADLLDDWTVHYAFNPIKREVEEAYRKMFGEVDRVTANSEGTAELARRFGRNDVELITNGVDPDRFRPKSTASGATTVGYVGKIGHRLDLDLVCSTARSLRGVRFVIAGPILDAGYKQPLEAEPNIELLGDVHYDDVPALLQSFDIGWVPHRVGDFEVGGDILKTYEYRAAGLPVLTTPVRGAGKRGLTSITVAEAQQHPRVLQELTAAGPRISRDSTPIPVEHTWQAKAQRILELAELP
jgi:glycosyltransferase involved in cell wall biosynthesis